MNQVFVHEQLDEIIGELEVGLICSSSRQIIVGNPLHKIGYGRSATKCLKPMKYRENVNTVKLNCLEKFVAFASNSLAIFDLEREISIRQLHDHDGAVTDIAWHRDSPYQLASVSREDYTLRTWDVRSHPAQVSVRRSQRPFSRVQYSPDCSFVACSGESISIFDLNAAQSVVNIGCSSYVTEIAFNPTECLLASASEDRLVRFWDVDTGECVTQSLPLESVVHKMEFHPDGKYLICATAQQFSAIVWEPFDTLFQTPKHPLKDSKLWRTLDMRICDDNLLQIIVPSNSSKFHSISSNSLLSSNPTSDAHVASVCLTSLPLADFEQCYPCSAPAKTGTVGFSETHQKDAELQSVDIPPVDKVGLLPSSFGTLHIAASSQPSSIKRPTQIAISPSRRRNPPISSIPLPFSSSFSRTTSLTPTSPTTEEPSSPFTSHSTLRYSSLDEADAIEDDCEGGEGRLSAASFGSSGGTNADELNQPSRLISPRISTGQSHLAMSQAKNRVAVGEHGKLKSSTRNRRPSSPFCGLTPNSPALNSPTESNLSVSFSPSKNPQNHAQIHNITPGTSAAKFSLKQSRSKSCGTTKSAKNIPQTSETVHNSTTNSSGNGNTDVVKTPSSTTNRQISTTSAKPDKSFHRAELTKLDEVIRATEKVQKIAKQRALEWNNFLSHTEALNSSNLCESMVDLASKQEDLRIFAGLLKSYLERPKSYSLSLNIKFLEKVRSLFAHSNIEYVILALDLLEVVVHAFGDSIRHGLAAKSYSLGVDVASEQRFERCSRCRSALLEVRMNAPFLVDRLDEAHKPTFNNILSQIDRFVEE